MANVKVPYLIERKNGDGSSRFYWSPTKDLQDAGWLRVRLDDDRVKAIAAAEQRNRELKTWRENQAAPAPLSGSGAGAPRLRRKGPQPGTVDELIAAYKASRFWNGTRNNGRPVLGEKSKRDYLQCLDRISDWCGDKPWGAITPAMANDFYEPLQANAPAMANAIMRVARLLWNRGRVLKGLKFNPFEDLGLIGLEFTGQIWPREAVPVFLEAAEDLGLFSIGTAIKVDEWIGQREADVLALPEAVSKDIALIQAKTGAGVDLPIGMVDELEQRILEQTRRNAARQVIALEATPRRKLLICELTGEPWNDDTFRHQFAAVRQRAVKIRPTFEADYIIRGRDPDAPDARTIKTSELKFMWLRHTAVTRLAEAGATDLQISAVSGHSEASAKQIRERYVIRTGTLAREAFRMRLEFEAKQARKA